MIGPNMATMLAVIMTDAQLSEADAQRVLINAAEASFNRISVEGHTSTNDALLLICSGKSGVEISSQSDLGEFESALTKSCIELAKCIPSDGEGATHLIAIQVVGAESIADADKVARTIAASALVKTAITGADPNWGRIVSAAGYSGVSMQANQIDLSINGHEVFKQGQPVKFDEPKVSQSMADNFETSIELKIGTGCESATHWTSDLTVEYVRFNSEYTT
jgi:glutamate N-acetyltransferase/amino-acid N-acetyltransferase